MIVDSQNAVEGKVDGPKLIVDSKTAGGRLYASCKFVKLVSLGSSFFVIVILIGVCLHSLSILPS